MGLARFHGNNVFATFINPNSLAAYLLIGIWLTVGLAVDGRGDEKIYSTRRIFSGLLLVLMLTTLYFTDSKGAEVACVIGAWFFVAQRIGVRFPQYRRVITGLTMATFVGLLVMLILGVSGILGDQPFGRSLQVRFEYWKAALNMIAQYPLTGVGLSGFAEHYPYFKTALGEEVKEVHNDYLQLWVEMGIIAPLVYLALWRLLLRAAPAARENSRCNTRVGNRTVGLSATERSESAEWPVVVGGILAFVCLYWAFLPFNAASLINLLHGESNAENLPGALQTLALPIIFVCVVIGLRQRRANAITTTTVVETNIGLQQGAKAAIGAVLTHQLVDFDLRVSAVMCAIFLLGGMLLALNGRQVESDRPSLLERWSRAILPLLAVALIPGAVWFSMTSGIPRRVAEDVETEARHISSQTSDHAQLQRYRELRDEVFSLRRQAAEATPFDADAWLELASACTNLTSTDPMLENQTLNCLRAAERLRSLSFIPKLQLANFYMRRSATGDFEKARQAYVAAAARYPLHPGIRLWTGDALLLQGQLDAAAAEYLEAFKIDLRISDSSVLLSSVFIDPRPGVFARHGHDEQVFTEVTKRLNSLAREKSDQLRQALLLRRLLTMAWLINESERAREVLTSTTLERMRADLTMTAESLVSSMTNLPERAHAALLLALAWQMRGSQKSSVAARQAWQQARALQQQTVERGMPGTPPDVFKRLADYYDK
ncbi:MAG: O-antigen ligase family protein [Planctomycetota bacterium]